MPETKHQNRRGIFVTGTDTGIGKTFIVTILIRWLETTGIKTTPRKPVESGCMQTSDGLLPADALAMRDATTVKPSLEEICPYRLEHPLSPERAAALEGVTLSLDMLEEACHAARERYLIVEGAGGFYSPIASDGLNADLAVRLGLPVLLVAPDRLGCINQVLLSTEAITNRGLHLAAVALNQLNDHDTGSMDNAKDLRRRLRCPVINIPHEGQRHEETGMLQLVDAIL